MSRIMQNICRDLVYLDVNPTAIVNEKIVYYLYHICLVVS